MSRRRLDVDLPSVVTAIVGAVVVEVVRYLASSFELKTYLLGLLRDPSSLAMTFAVVLLVFPGARFTLKMFLLGLAANQAGIKNVFTAAPYIGEDRRSPEAQRQDYEAVQSYLRSAVTPGSHVDLLLVSGFKTIGTEAQPGFLFEHLKKAGSVCALLLHPNSDEAHRREINLKNHAVINADVGYRQGIADVLAHLRALRNFGIDLEVKLYSQRPIWRMVAVNDLLVLQGASDSIPSEQATAFAIRRGEHSLFDPLMSVFRKKWYAAGESVNAPDVIEVVGAD